MTFVKKLHKHGFDQTYTVRRKQQEEKELNLEVLILVNELYLAVLDLQQKS